MGRRTAVCAAAMIACAGTTALAEPVFSNAPADRISGSGHEMTSWLQADDFRLTSDTVLTGAQVEWFTMGGLQNWDHVIEWSIYASGGGMPGHLIASGSGVNVMTTHEGQATFDWYTTTFEFDNPVAMYAGSTYWFGLHFSGDYASRDDLYWANATSSQLGYSQESMGGTLDNWQNVSNMDRAFALIPAPGASALAVCTGLVLWRRRR
jgi:hypothetical protein